MKKKYLNVELLNTCIYSIHLAYTIVLMTDITNYNL